eukprot:gene15059-20263_t
MSDLDTSFDAADSMDLANVIAEFRQDPITAGQMPNKKLCEAFDNCIKDRPAEDTMKVFLRVRPIMNKADCTITVDSQYAITTTAPDSSKRALYTRTDARNYVFNRVFGPESQQEEVYDKIVPPLLQRFINGESCVLFAYGMTNAGKTYTIQGSDQNPGLLPRLVKSVLNQMENSPIEWNLQISMLEVYQEKVYDLLNKKRDKLNIRDGNGKVEVGKLTAHKISVAEDATKLMNFAQTNRSKSNTLLNTGSSRSHAVYTVTLNRIIKGHENSITFQMVDLAGAERGNRTNATATQQKEANVINVSLMQLWRCLQGMKKKVNADGVSSVQDIIPFRESKLTHILMPNLNKAGLGGVAMITCVNPQSADYDETLTILGNASLASKIKEIADLGRTGNFQASTFSSENHTNNNKVSFADDQKEKTNTLHSSSTAIAAAAATNAAAIAAGTKRRRAEGSGSLNSTKSIRDSTITTFKDGAVLKKSQSQHIGKGINFAAVDTNNASTESHNTADPTIARILNEIEQLRKENLELKNDQFTRETEIREEVSIEMAMRSNHLLNQIQELRNQLAEYEESKMINVTKSVKKVRKRQFEEAQLHVGQDLREAEDEIERIKSIYEQEINDLKSEKNKLEEELESYRSNTNQAERKTRSSNRSTKSSKRTSKHENTTVDVSQEFASRMQRDHRFISQGSVQIVQNENMNNVQILTTASPARSPLGVHNANSIQVQVNSSPNKISKSGKVFDTRAGMVSPSKAPLSVAEIVKSLNSKNQIQQDENSYSQVSSANNNSGSGNPYFTRLRSQFTRV